MAFKPSNQSWLGIDSVAGSMTNRQPYIDSVDWPQSVEQTDVSAFGTSSKSFIPNLTDGDDISISGPYDATMFTALTAVKAAQAAGSATCTVLWGPGGSVSGQASVSAECWVKSVAFKSAVGGRVEYAASLQVTGAVTNTTF